MLLVKEDDPLDIHDTMYYKLFMTSLRQLMMLKHHVTLARVTKASIAQFSKPVIEGIIANVGRTLCPACTGSSTEGVKGIQIRVCVNVTSTK